MYVYETQRFIGYAVLEVIMDDDLNGTEWTPHKTFYKIIFQFNMQGKN